MITAIGCMAQRRQLQEARLILKGDKDYDKAETMMLNLLNDSTHLEYRDNPRIYDMWLQSVEKQYSQLNEMMYKKQEVDTVQLFDLTHRLFMIGERLDSIDMRPDKKGRVSPEYRKDNASRLIGYRPNLFFGGTYHLRKGDYPRAYDFFERYIDCTRQPLFSEQHLDSTDSRLPEAAYWATYSAYRQQNAVQTLRYRELALRDTSRMQYTLQYIAEARHWLKDDSLYMETLREGFLRYPRNPYFFPRLMDYYTSRNENNLALETVNHAIAANDSSQLTLFAKATVLFNLGRFNESIVVNEMLLQRNDSFPDPYYNIGICYMNKALEFDVLHDKKTLRRVYQKARQYMERYRELAPKEQQKWGPALYRIYLNLNMGKQFDEIDRLLKSDNR